jgi:hypothetical protein
MRDEITLRERESKYVMPGCSTISISGSCAPLARDVRRVRSRD